MTPQEALQTHLHLCDEVYQLTLEENRFLKQHQRTPEDSLLARKRVLLGRLDESLTALKAGAATPTTARPDAERKETIVKAREKILQILHLDRENEQLLLRHSLGARARPPAAAATTAPVSYVQRLYDQHT